MGERTEKLEIRQVHDNDAWDINQNISERATGEELKAYYKQIVEGIKRAKEEITNEERTHEMKTKNLNDQLEILQKREEVFREQVAKITIPEKKEEKK